jgi:hypothetical protein
MPRQHRGKKRIPPSPPLPSIPSTSRTPLPARRGGCRQCGVWRGTTSRNPRHRRRLWLHLGLRWGGLETTRSLATAATVGRFAKQSELCGSWVVSTVARRLGRGETRSEVLGEGGGVYEGTHRVRLTPTVFNPKRLTNGAHHEGPTQKPHTKGMRPMGTSRVFFHPCIWLTGPTCRQVMNLFLYLHS